MFAGGCCQLATVAWIAAISGRRFNHAALPGLQGKIHAGPAYADDLRLPGAVCVAGRQVEAGKGPGKGSQRRRQSRKETPIR